MRCELCDEKTDCIYATSKNGLICGECYRKLRDSDEGRLGRRKEMLKMFKRYGLDIKE